MKIKNILILFFLITLTISIYAQNNVILVEIGDTVISTEDLLNKIDNLPAMNTARFRSIEGQKQILDMMITEQLFFLRAKELGYDQLEEVKNAIQYQSQPLATQIYVQELIAREYVFDPASVEAFYKENIHFYTVPARATIQHLQTTPESLEEVLNDIFAGDDFAAIIEKHSTNTTTKRNNGIITNIRLVGHIAGIGQDSELDLHITEAEVDQLHIYGPFETVTGIHFFRKLSWDDAIVRPFEELQNELEGIVRGQAEHRVYANHIQSLHEKYNVKFNEEALEFLNLHQIAVEQRDILIVESSHPDIRINLMEAANIIRYNSQREMMESLNNPVIQERLIREEMDKRTLTVAATDANIYETNKDSYAFQEVALRVILTYFNSKEIQEKIEVTDDELHEFYANNTDMYMVPAHRSIRQFVSNDDRSARNHHRDIARMLRRNQHDRIADYITTHSLAGINGGLLEFIYRNNIIPTVGVDENYNAKVFELKVGQLSDIFNNINDEIVFFYVVSETPTRVRPLSEVESSLRSIIHRRKATAALEEMKNELLEEYTVITHLDRIVTQITAEELFHAAEVAQRMGQTNECLLIFDAIIADFSGTEHAYRALFMKGFVASENQNTINQAIQAFQELIDNYPDGEMNDSAEVLLDMLKSGETIDLMQP